MSAMPKFSVVLAGYQTAPYLEKSLGSIRNQTFQDFEAICYVEESTDDSLAICRSVADCDPRFKVVSAPKSGAVSSTRNYGIDHAAGEYLVFVDGDDWVRTDMLERLAAKLDDTGEVDVLAFAADTLQSGDEYPAKAKRMSNFGARDAEGTFTGLDAIRRTGRNGGSLHNFTCFSAYRTAFLRGHGIYQQVGRVMEDFEWTPRVWFAAKRFAYLDEALYVYRRRANSLTTEASARIATDVVANLRSLLGFVAANDIPGDILAIWANQWFALLCWFMFHPVTSRKISDADRLQALRSLMADGGRESLKRLAPKLSRPRRLAFPLVLLAARGMQLPAKVFFRRLYYPLIELRQRQ